VDVGVFMFEDVDVVLPRSPSCYFFDHRLLEVLLGRLLGIMGERYEVFVEQLRLGRCFPPRTGIFHTIVVDCSQEAIEVIGCFVGDGTGC